LTTDSIIVETRMSSPATRSVYKTRSSLHSTSFALGSEVISVTTFNVVHKVHNSVTSVR